MQHSLSTFQQKENRKISRSLKETAKNTKNAGGIVPKRPALRYPRAVEDVTD